MNEFYYGGWMNIWTFWWLIDGWMDILNAFLYFLYVIKQYIFYGIDFSYHD